MYNTDMLCQFLTTMVSPEGALFVAGQCHGLDRSWFSVFKGLKSQQNILVYDCERKVYHLYTVILFLPMSQVQERCDWGRRIVHLHLPIDRS